MRSIRIGVFITFVAVFSGFGTLKATAQLGFAAGLNFENMTDIEVLDASTTFDNASGYHAGIFYDMSFGMGGIRIGAFYRDLGEFDSKGAVEDELGKVDLTMIDFPLDIRLNLLNSPAVQPYAIFGPVLSLPKSNNDIFDGTLESFFVSGNIGVGISLNLGSVRLYPEFRYAVGVSRLVADDAEIGGIELQSDDTRVDSAMLRLGVIF